MTTTSYSGIGDAVDGVVDKTADEGIETLRDNVPEGLALAGGFVVWKVAKRVLRSIA